MEASGCLAGFVDGGSVESHRYFLARRTLLEMLSDRGYSVAVTELDQTLAEFRALYGDQPEPSRLQITTSLLSDPSNKVLAMFCGVDSVKLPTVRAIKTLVKSEWGDNLSRLILVVKNTLSAQARQATKEFPYKVEIFKLTDLLTNIMKHVLMPKHEILTAEQKASLLKKYSVEDKQLPRMLETDAVARYLGLEKGQVVKITHTGETTGTHIAYRCVM